MEPDGELSRADVEALVALHTSRIAETVPEGEMSVSGSTLLGRYGGHDVDPVVLVPDVSSAAERLRRTYPPLYESEWRDDWAAFRLDGTTQVDIVVTAPGTSGDDHHLARLGADPRQPAIESRVRIAEGRRHGLHTQSTVLRRRRGDASPRTLTDARGRLGDVGASKRLRRLSLCTPRYGEPRERRTA